MTKIELTLNGRQVEADIDPRLLLVDAVRETFGLKGTHVGCRTGDCGACTVLLDGRPEKSCLRLAVSADGCDVKTIEGIASNGDLHPVQQAFWDQFGFQCGFCLPGMLFAALDLLQANPHPSRSEILAAIDGNLCRCTGYQDIVTSIATAAERLAVAGGGH